MRLEYQFTPEKIIEEGRTTREHINFIKQWLSTRAGNDIPRVQDELIVLFLLSCANNLDLTKNTIVMYYKCKRDAPEIFDNREIDRPDLKKGLNTIHMSSIPVRTDNNSVIHYFNINDNYYKNFDLEPIMKLSYMLLDISQETNPPNALIVVIDMKGFGLMHLTKLRLGALKKYFTFLQEGFPIKLEVIHILNAVYFFDKILSIIKVFMKSELIGMLKVHPPNIEKEKLFSMVPKKCLPAEYGGDLPSEKELHETLVEQYKNKQEFWKVEESIRKIS